MKNFKKLFGLILAITLVLLIPGCPGAEPKGTVISVTITQGGNPVTEDINAFKGETLVFSAEVIVQGNAADTVDWSIEGASAATTINAGALRIAATEADDAEITVTASSTADPDKRDTVTVKLVEQEKYTITVENGIIDGATDENGQYLQNSLIWLIAEDRSAVYEIFVSWTLDGEVVSNTMQYSLRALKDGHYVANFENDPNYERYTITVQNGTINGTVDKNGQYPQDSLIWLSADDRSAIHQLFVSWTLDGTVVSNDAQYSLKALRDGHYIANFIRDPNYEPLVPEPGDPSFAARTDLYRFYDDFSVGDASDNNMLDLTKWGYDEGGGGFGNNELQYYHRDNVRIVDCDEIPGNRKVVMTLKRQNMGSRNFTSGKFWARPGTTTHGPAGGPGFSSTYGKIEARIRLFKKVFDAGLDSVVSVTAGSRFMAGLWPAFWMMPRNSDYGGWPTSGEIDIMEVRGRFPAQMNATIHRRPSSGGGGETWVRMNTGSTTTTGNSLVRYSNSTNSGYSNDYFYADTVNGIPADSHAGEWHIYTVEWEYVNGIITFRYYVDDVLYLTINESQWRAYQGGTELVKPAPFNRNFYPIFNLALGGNFDGNRTPANAAGDVANNNQVPADAPIFAADAPPIEYEIDWVVWREIMPRDGEPGGIQKPIYDGL